MTKQQNESQASAIYRWLEEEIMSGRLAPGDRLDDAAIAERFAVSKTPVRDAFLQLAAIDFVTLKQRVGAIVTPLSLQKMVQMFEVMAKLEGTAAALAAERMTGLEKEALVTSSETCMAIAERGGEKAQEVYAEANFDFHEIVYRGSHNDYLREQASMLRRRLAPYRRFWLSTDARRQKSSSEHAEVTRAIVESNIERARFAMEAHLDLTSGLLSELLGVLPSGYLAGIRESDEAAGIRDSRT